MWEYRDRVAVAGVGYSPLTRGSPSSLGALTLQACDAALADAGVARSQVDGLGTMPENPRYGGVQGGVNGVDVAPTTLMAGMLGIEDSVLWVSDTHQMVAQSVIDAVNALCAGTCSYVLIWRSAHVPSGRYSDYSQSDAAGVQQFRAPYGFSIPAAWAGQCQARYMHLTGCTRESFGRFIVQNREHTNRNPKAFFYGRPLTLDEYLNARMIADPCCLFDCDIPVDGAAALLLTTTERARDLRNPPALITGYAASTHSGPGGIPYTIEDNQAGSERLGRRLWTAAGLGPSDMDAAEVFDGFSIWAFTWLEGLGLTPRGEAFRFIDDGRARLDGELPVNTSGCSLGEGRLHGMSQITEAALQVMGRADERQVPGAAHVVATEGNGGYNSHGFVFSRG
jgi:acetyl-CoA acetyltransferase